MFGKIGATKKLHCCEQRANSHPFGNISASPNHRLEPGSNVFTLAPLKRCTLCGRARYLQFAYVEAKGKVATSGLQHLQHLPPSICTMIGVKVRKEGSKEESLRRSWC